jgi:threonine synthase
VVAVCTGHGLKDPDIIVKNMPAPQVLEPEINALEKAIV